MKEVEKFKPRYGLVVLDFHGTLTDHQLRMIRALGMPAKEVLGESLPKILYQKAMTRPSKESGQPQSMSEWIHERLLVSNKNSNSNGDSDFVNTTFINRYNHYMENSYIPVPGMRKVLRGFANEGIQLAVLTNGKKRLEIFDTLEQWKLSDLANNLYSSHLTGVKKPDPAAIDYILDDFECRGKYFQKKDMLIVGDIIDDTGVASQAGVDSALLIRSTGQEEIELRDPKPTYVVTNFEELSDVVFGKTPIETRSHVKVQPSLWKNDRWGKIVQ
jgi:FMN phosphatase YigB (HAD superfamily)